MTGMGTHPGMDSGPCCVIGSTRSYWVKPAEGSAGSIPVTGSAVGVADESQWLCTEPLQAKPGLGMNLQQHTYPSGQRVAAQNPYQREIRAAGHGDLESLALAGSNPVRVHVNGEEKEKRVATPVALSEDGMTFLSRRELDDYREQKVMLAWMRGAHV